MERICVFCGSSPGLNPAYSRAARQLGEELASRDIGLVYGGGSIGVMGEIAGAVSSNGGVVTGVIPKALADEEVANLELSDLQVVSSMHERKALMSELSDGFIALPGGLGTFEEFFEVLTWAQLGLHQKPCGLLDTEGFYTPLLNFLDHVLLNGFISADVRAMILVDSSPADLLDRFDNFEPRKIDKAAWAKQMSGK